MINVELYILPPNTTSKSQPVHASIVEAMKVRYRWRQTNREIDFLDIAENDKHKVDVLLKMKWLTGMWNKMSAQTISNCWMNTRIIMDRSETVDGS